MASKIVKYNKKRTPQPFTTLIAWGNYVIPMPYLDWNQRVFDRVFNTDRKNRITTVYVDEDILHEWATEMGLGTVNAAESVRLFVDDCLRELGRDPANIANYCGSASHAWANGRLKGAPLYMGMLALLVLASGWGEGSGHLYYGRYWRLTGSESEGTIPRISDLQRVWKQLEAFSSVNSYELGIYKVRTLAPAKVNVGIIVAQSVLRREDEKVLRDIFYDEGADSNVEYTDQHIRSWLDKHHGKLSARAHRALDSRDNADYLIGRVREELEEWDGEPADASNLMGRSRSFRRNAYLCLNRGSGGVPYAVLRLDFAGRSGDPESVTFGQDAARYSAYSNGDAISTPLESIPVVSVDSTGPRPTPEALRLILPADFQKFIGGEFKSEIAGNSYKYLVGSGAIRVFVDGAALGVGGYVECFGLKPSYGHIVFYKDGEVTEEVKAWCQQHADPLIDIRSIVPSYFSASAFWKVFAIRANVPACEAPRANCLTYEIRPLARFSGGLKLYRRGNKYLAAMPPIVNLVSRHAVNCKVNDEPEFTVEGTALDLRGRLPLGTSKITLRELVDEGQQSELSLIVLDSSEWAKEAEGTLHTLSALPVKAPDAFKGVLGGWKAAYSPEAGECHEMKASWQHLDKGLMIPCVPPVLIAGRIKVMADVRHNSFTVGKHAAWRAVIDGGRLHPAFNIQSIKVLWDAFVQKSR